MNVIRIEQTSNAIADLKAAVSTAKAFNGPTLIHINSDPLIYAPDGEGWWDVPVAATSTLASTQEARAAYEKALKKQKPLLGRGSVERNN